MRSTLIVYLISIFISAGATAGDYAIGGIKYKVDLGQTFDMYKMTKKDFAWGVNLSKKLKYQGKVIYFVRTSLVLLADGKKLEGAVYHAIDKPDYFYVLPGDAMLVVGAKRPISPGVGGFSMITPKSKNFIACFNCFSGGVPFIFGSSITLGKVVWYGDDFHRL